MRIDFFLKAVENGNKFIWHTFPKFIEFWLAKTEPAIRNSKIYEDFGKRLEKLPSYKVASFLTIFLSKFNEGKNERLNSPAETI